MGIVGTGEQILPWDLQLYHHSLRVEKLQIDPAEIEIGTMGRIALVGAFTGSETEQDSQAARTTRELYARGHIGNMAVVGIQIIQPSQYSATDLRETAEHLERSVAGFKSPAGDFGRSLILDEIVPGHLELSPGGGDEYRSGRLGYLLQRAWMQFEIAAGGSEQVENARQSLIVVTDPETAALADPDLSYESLACGGLVTYSTQGRINRWIPSIRTGCFPLEEPKSRKTLLKRSRSSQAADRPDDTLRKQSDAILSHHSLGPEMSA